MYLYVNSHIPRKKDLCGKSLFKPNPLVHGENKILHIQLDRAGLGPSPGWGPYGPIWALMGPYIVPYGPLWALMGAYGPEKSQKIRLCWVRVGAQSGLGPGPGWGPYGPIWALMFFVKNVTFRVQTAPFDKITIDFWRSRRRLYIPDLLKAKNSNVRLSFFKGSVFIKSVMFRVQTAPFDKITIDFCRSRRRLHDSDLPGAKNTKSDQNSKITFFVVFSCRPHRCRPHW